MTLLRWNETDRETLAAVLPEALVVLPIGATEQHGPHLPTGTDAFLATAVAESGVTRAQSRVARDLVLAPTLSFGASDHHFPFGATLSLTTETMATVLLELARSVSTVGGRRLLIVNGHGGNIGPCTSAAAAASTRYDIAVAHLSYWDLLPADLDHRPHLPGHAGEFETSLVLALRPELVRPRPQRESPPAVPAAPDVSVAARALWANVDGFSDRPVDADAAAGQRWHELLADALADRLVTLAKVL